MILKFLFLKNGHNSNFARNNEYNIYYSHSNKQFRAGINDHMRMPEWGAVLKLSLHCYFINFRINLKNTNMRKNISELGEIFMKEN